MWLVVYTYKLYIFVSYLLCKAKDNPLFKVWIHRLGLVGMGFLWLTNI